MFLSQRFLYMAIIAVALIVICLQLVSIQLNTEAAKQQVLDMFKSPFATIASRVGPPKPTVIGADKNINVTKVNWSHIFQATVDKSSVIGNPCDGVDCTNANVDRCLSGMCMCGSGNPPCSGTTDTCTSGSCRCGSN